MKWRLLWMLILPTGLAAQVDPSGPWRTWSSEHFRIHAKAEHRDLALRAAREAERAYALYADVLPMPRGRIELTVIDNVDGSNGRATVFPTNRMTIWAPPPSAVFGLEYYDEWLRTVITHELAHIVHMNPAAGVWGVMRHVFGRAPFLFPNGFQPVWVREGVATYYETRFTTLGRVRGAYHGQILSAAASGNTWRSSNELWISASGWPGGVGPYVWGSRFFALQAASGGDQVVDDFVARSAARLWPLAMSPTLKGVGGIGVRTGWSRLREEYANEPLPTATLVRAGLRREPGTQANADGTRLAYIEDDGRSVTRLVVVDLTSGERILSKRLQGRVEFAWVDDAIVVSQSDYISAVDIRRDLYHLSMDGTWRRVTRGARLGGPFPASPGTFGAVDIGAGNARLVQVVRGDVEPLAAPPASSWATVVRSPSGHLLAGARNLDGAWDIVVWPVGAPEQWESVTADDAFDADPTWGPDGTLYFVSERYGPPQVFAVAGGRGTVFQVTNEPGGVREPAVGSDGSMFFTTVDPDGISIRRRSLGPWIPTTGRRLTAPQHVQFIEAPTVNVRELGYSPLRSLLPSYWTPFVFDVGGSTGVFFGAATSARDPIGRTSYVASGAISPERRLQASFVVRHQRWKAFSTSLALRQDWDYLGRTRAPNGESVPISERSRLVRADLGWQRPAWWSNWSVNVGVDAEEEVHIADGDGVDPDALPNDWFVGASSSVSFVRLERPDEAISRENGVDLTGFYRRRWRVSGDLDPSDEFVATAAAYLGLNLPGFSHWVLAVRGTHGRSWGEARSTFSVGGVSSDVASLGSLATVGVGRRTFGLRSYPRLTGFTRAFSGIGELRIPLVRVAQGFGFVPVGFDRLSMSLFGELGAGWREGTSFNLDDLAGVGGEIVFDMIIGYDVPIRVRVGAALPLKDGFGILRRDTRVYVALGDSF